MILFIRRHSLMFASLCFGLWIFIVWRLTGMPSPGFLGRIIPGAWVVAAALSGRSKMKEWFSAAILLFTISAWLWMVLEPGWIIAAAIASAGLTAWGIQRSSSAGSMGFLSILPVLFLILFTAEVNSDEVRFAEISVSVTGINSEIFSHQGFRAGDISRDVGHHTMVYPILISPGLLAGDSGLRIIPVLLTIAAVALLAKAAGPSAAVAAALLYPGFSTLGLAMTGWLAAGLLSISLLLGKDKKHHFLRLTLVVFLIALKMRYAGLAIGILLAEYACMKPIRGKWMIPSIVVLGGALLLAVDRYILGGEIFWMRYGNIEMLRIVWINIFHRPLATISNAGWSLFDPEAGLIFRAPWSIAAFYGLGLLRHKSPQLFKRAVIPSVIYWTVLIIWSGTSWHGLPAPAGRVFLPMLPMLALGLKEVLNRYGTRFLLIISLAFPAIASVYPYARANYADGTDSILALFGSHSGFSMVRSNSLYLLPALFAVISIIVLLHKKLRSAGFLCLLVFSSAVASGLYSSVLDAEDLTGENVQGALLYPASSDPVERYFWFISRERMLEMSRPEHNILVNGVHTGDTLLIEASSAGGVLIVGGDSLSVSTELMDLPEEYAFIGRRVETLPDLPENRLLIEYKLPIISIDGTVRVCFGCGEPVYIDRIGVL